MRENSPSALELVDLDSPPLSRDRERRETRRGIAGAEAEAEADADEEGEADMLLLEVGTTKSAPAIPSDLIHGILNHGFSKPSRATRKETEIATETGMSISRDARELVARYIEVFAREAVARSVFERGEQERGREARSEGKDGTWLEVADLEGVAVQLGLDF